MPISHEERYRILGLAKVQRLQSDGLRALAEGRDAESIADQLLTLHQQSPDPMVAELAALAHAGIASGMLSTARTALASVNDQIATATNTFAIAARIAREGEAALTFPFLAGKAAAMLDLVGSLKQAVKATEADLADSHDLADLYAAFESARAALDELRRKAETLG